jgi:hypothetical protein
MVALGGILAYISQMPQNNPIGVIILPTGSFLPISVLCSELAMPKVIQEYNQMQTNAMPSEDAQRTSLITTNEPLASKVVQGFTFVQDTATKAWAAERTGRYYAHSHSVKHDIITGDDLKVPCTVPEKYRVIAPWEKQGKQHLS